MSFILYHLHFCLSIFFFLSSPFFSSIASSVILKLLLINFFNNFYYPCFLYTSFPSFFSQLTLNVPSGGYVLSQI